MSRRAEVADVDAICRSLPEVELGTSWGDRPTYLVRQKPKPRGFVLERAPRARRRRPRDRRGVPRPAGDPHRERRRQGRAGRGRRAVLHHRPLPQLQRRARPAEPDRRGRRRRAARGAHRRLARRGAEVAGEEVPGGRAVSAAPDPARRAAFEVLKAVRAKDAYTNLVLPHQLGKYRLTGRDAAFATELAAGTIRRQGTYDAILAACTDRPLATTAAKVLDVLRLGCHQLLGMRVAPHAAISTSVDLVRSEVGPGSVGVRQRRAPQGLGPRPRHLAHPASTPTGPRRSSHPAVDRRRPGGSADRGRRRRRDRGAAGRRQRAARGHPGGPARAARPPTSSGRADAATRRTA